MKNIKVNKNELINLINSGLTIYEISKEMNISNSTINRRMKDYGIKSKSIELKYEYVECEECHKKFKALKSNNRKFCSKKCSIDSNYKILKDNREQINIKISKSMIKIDYVGYCLNCGSEFIRKRKNRIYCCNKCRAKHISNKPENKKRVGEFFSDLTKKRHENGDTSIGWQSRNKLSLSYPEKITLDYLNNKNISFKREYKIGKYFIDFAFINKKIALEIDGRTHDDYDVIEKDKRKDKFLKSKGWKVYRIKWINNNKHFDKLKAFIVQMDIE